MFNSCQINIKHYFFKSVAKLSPFSRVIVSKQCVTAIISRLLIRISCSSHRGLDFTSDPLPLILELVS